ncbi:MAG: isoleucine--tRNA ligase [Sphingomonadales bacterium]|nr:isoleucine--tRNA ligase [Sphingomonadales bacterium]
MSTKYREFTGLNLPAIEKEVLERWSAHQAFEKSVSLREGSTPFVFYEGPPSANGMPGIHHVISRTLKDMVCRYKTMQGFQVKRKGGWDTHGLPVELGVEKELGITKEDIGVKISVAEYNKACREAVLRYKDKWDTITRKMGYWVDLQHPYITFESSYIETLWWLLSELYKKGLLYESVSIQPYSPAAGTGLSSHELNQPGTYKDVKDTSCVAMFKLEQSDRSQFLFDQLKQQDQRPEASTVSNDIFLLAWTTTPWTLPSNLGLTVGAQIEYALVSTINPYTFLPVNVVLATALLSKYFKPEGENQPIEAGQEKIKILPWKILSTFSGAQLEECHYQQLLPFEANSPAAIEANTPGARPFRVLTDSFVTTQDGTGIVHTAPAFGADDYKVGKKYGIGLLTLVDREGKFINGVGEFSGRYVKDYKNEPGYVDVNIDISVKLKKENRAFKVEKYEHSYPHCWRTDKPILYYPLDAWFIRTTALRDRMVALNKTIQWKPASTGEGRFGNWLENMVDWNLSRSRYWGTPLPIWRTEDGEETICIGSIAQLKEEIARSVAAGHEIGNCKKDAPDLAARIDAVVSDLHKPYVDEIVLVSASGKPMRRVPDLIDVWFDSGAMPYAQWGLPDTSSGKYGPLSPENFFRYHALNKNSGADEHSFPASFIAEGVDQTRGWFYTLHAIAGLLFDSVAYQTVVSNGLVLDKNGNKMSKRLGNVVDPFATIDSFGADATRWYLITNASPWDNLRFDSEGIREVQRKFFGTLYNTYQFFVLYANVDGFTYKEAPIASNDRPEIDRWILSCLHTLTARVTTLMNEYEPTAAGRLLEDFVDEQLSNWYVRLCRRRFWKGEYSQDKIAAYQTLYECMETVLRLMAPISPFFSDALFNELNTITGRHSQQSVHHVLYPVADENYIDRPLEERMQLAQDASSLVLSLRKKVNIKVRQPLQKVLIPVLDTSMQSQLEAVEALIKAEVNVKEISYLQADNTFISKKIKPNFVALGKKLGSKMKAVSAALASFSQAEIAQLEKEGQYTLSFEEGPVTLLLSDTDITSEDIPGWTVASKGKLTVALDITITPELAAEGIAREFVNRIQKIRKDAGFELTDKILVQVMAPASLTDALANFKAYICAEILAEKLEFQSSLSQATAIDINDEIINVLVTKNG